MAQTETLRIDRLTFSYPDSGRNAVDSFDLAVDRGEVVLLAGPSGCGKSTLLRSINGLIPHMYSGSYSGEVRVEGASVKDTPMRDLAQRVGFLFQNPENQIFMFTVERDVAFGLENLGVPRDEMRDRVDEAMRRLDITPLARRAPHELSDGQKQRVALAGVLAMRPSLVILDEPTSLLDPLTAAELVRLIDGIRRETRTTFIVVEHRLDLLVRIADRIVVMSEGRKVLDGPPAEVLANEKAAGFGVSVPAVPFLQTSLGKAGIRFPRPLFSPEDLATELNQRSQ